MPTAKLTPSKIGAPGSLNFNSYDGKAVPAFKPYVLDSTDSYHYAVNVVEYKAPPVLASGDLGGQPRQYCARAKTVYRLDDGVVSDDVTGTSSTAFNDVCQGMVVCSVPEDGTPGTFTLGNHPGLLVTFGTGNPVAGQTGVQYRLLDTDSSTPWNAASDAATTYLTAWQIIRAGPDLYAVCDSGRTTTLGDYRVSKCPVGNNPVLAASWFNGFEVGGNDWMITGLAAIGDSCVVAKPDGLYYYSDLTKRYENVLSHYQIVPHALNGKGIASVTGGVVYPTNDGNAYFFDGVAAQEISPNKFWQVQDRDIGNSRITAICDRGDEIQMFQELGYQTTQQGALLINKVTSANVASDITSLCIDGKLSTGGDISSLNAGSIDIWSSNPFEGAIFYVTRKSNSTTTAFIASVSYTSANNTFTADPNGFIDGTRLAQLSTSPSGSFSNVNLPPSASAGLVMGKSPNWGTLQQAVTYTYAGGANITTAAYGMRITIQGTLDASVNLDEVEVIPFRPGMPNSDGGIYTTSTNFTARNRAGLVGHVISMKRKQTTGFLPVDRFAVYSYPGVWAMSAFNGRIGQPTGSQNLGPNLVLWGRYSVTAISESPTRYEIRSRWPFLAPVSTASPGPLQQIAIDWDEGKADIRKRLNQIRIDSRFVQPTDQTEIFAQFDNQDIVSVGKAKGGPATIRLDQAPFRYLNLWLGFKQDVTATVTTPNAPYFVEPYILDFEEEGTPGDWDQDRATQIPQAT